MSTATLLFILSTSIVAASEGSRFREGWLWGAVLLLVIGIFTATIRKTFGNFSRKGVLERLGPTDRDRFVYYFNLLEHYGVSLRIVDQIVRMGLVGSVVLAFAPPLIDQAATGYLAAIGLFAVLIIIVFVTFIVALELIPAVLSKISPERLMLTVLPVLHTVFKLTVLPIQAYSRLVSSVAGALGTQPARRHAEVVEEEILTAVEEGEREGVIEKSEMSMIEAIFRFGDRNVSEILTPRTEMVSLEVSTPATDFVHMASDCGHSRIPVFQGNKDNVIGILYVKDLLKFWNDRADSELKLEEILREPHFVSRSKKISELFQEFQTQRFHIAIVQDDFGGTAGLITIEDIVEEVLGDIEEEHETGESPERLVRLGDGAYDVDARLLIDELNQELRDELPVPLPEDDGFDTVGGFVFNAMGKVPSIGEIYCQGPFRFEILAADERSIRRLRVHITKSEATAGSEN